MGAGNSFAGRVAFITGASSGIGQATAIAFAAEGADVVATGIDLESNAETAQLAAEHGGRVLTLRCDVTQTDDIAAALSQTLETFGRIDIAFNNAGVEQPPAALADIGERDWDQLFDVDVRGVFLCMKHEIPLMLAAGSGVIVNTSSGAGVIGIRGQAAYAAAKHAVIGLTRSAALDYASAGQRRAGRHRALESPRTHTHHARAAGVRRLNARRCPRRRRARGHRSDRCMPLPTS
jgi:NAD(P)-dependent dehydrogenase (short-subunit alcohol dehydrogenase family)